MLTGGYGTNRFFSRSVMDAFTAAKEDPSAVLQEKLDSIAK